MCIVTDDVATSTMVASETTEAARLVMEAVEKADMAVQQLVMQGEETAWLRGKGLRQDR